MRTLFAPKVRFGTGLQLYYNLNHGPYTSGKVFDYSRNGNTGTIVGALPAFPGFTFDGQNDYIDTGATFQSTFRSNFSIGVWFKISDGQPSLSNVIFGSSITDGNIVLYITSDGYLDFQYVIGGDTARFTGNSPTLVNGQEDWHFAIVTGDPDVGGSGGLLVYMDGSLMGNTGADGDTSTVTFTDWTSTYNLFIGALSDAAPPPQNPYAGEIGEVMLYNKTLTAAEIKGLYQQTRRSYRI